MDTQTATLSHLLRQIARHRAEALRITVEIGTITRRMNTLLARRVPGEMIDAIEDEIIALRDQLMANDVAMMDLVERARSLNDRRPEPHRINLELAFRAMAAPGGGGERDDRTLANA